MKKSSRKSSKISPKTKSTKLSSKKDYSRKGYYAQFGIDVNDKKAVKKHLDEELRIIQNRTKKLQGGIGSGPSGQSLQSQKDDLRNELLKIKSRQESDKIKAKECVELLIKHIAEDFEIISMSEEKLHGKFNAKNGKKWDVLLTRDDLQNKIRKNPKTTVCPYCHTKLMFGTNMCRNCGPI